MTWESKPGHAPSARREPFVCTPEDPWAPEKTVRGQLVRHPQAREEGEQSDGWPGGDIVRMRCPVCGHTWTEELPQ